MFQKSVYHRVPVNDSVVFICAEYDIRVVESHTENEPFYEISGGSVSDIDIERTVQRDLRGSGNG